MTPEDDFDLRELGGALDRATPRPDAGVRAAHLRLAQENFQRLHAAAPARAGAAPGRGAWAGLRGFLGSFAHPGAVSGATAMAALALLMVTPTGQVLLRGPLSVGESDGALPTEAMARDEPEAATAPEAEEAAGAEAPLVAGTGRARGGRAGGG
jgi:Ca-activated chloride channel family protein